MSKTVDSFHPEFPDFEHTDVMEDIGYKHEYDEENGRKIREYFASLKNGETEEALELKLAPTDESGAYQLDQLRPGMFIAGWGPVTGRDFKPNDTIFDDIEGHPQYVSAPVRPFQAAKVFAKKINQGNIEGAQSWRDHATNQGWRRVPKNN